MDEGATQKYETVNVPEREHLALERRGSSDLVETITNHIVPRLLLAHRMDSRMDARELERAVDARPPSTEDDVVRLTELAVEQDASAVIHAAEARLRSGVTFESLLLDWIAAAARMLGEQWLNDERSFADVSLGLGTLHRVLAILRHRFGSPLSHRGMVVLATVPGEQHTLAINVLGDLLRLLGWDAIVEPNLGEEQLVSIVATEPVAMVGLSVSNDDLVAPLERIVSRVREASLNRDLVVMLGGAVDLSTFAEGIGAVYCPSARTALGWLERHARVSL